MLSAFQRNRAPHTRATPEELRAVRDGALAEADRVEATDPVKARVLRLVKAPAFDDMARRQEADAVR